MTDSVIVQVPGSNKIMKITTMHRYKVCPYTCVGSGEEHQGKKSLNFFRIFISLDTPQQRLMCELIESYDHETGFSNMLPWKNQSYFSEALVALKKLQLVVRVKKGQYMLNPNLIVNPKHYLRLVLVWGDLVKSE